jgi:hypothetical protein
MADKVYPKCPVKVWPAYGRPRQCSRSALGKRGLCMQHEKMLDRYNDLPLIDGGSISVSGLRHPPRVRGEA